MPLILSARVTFDPRGILLDRWRHDMAHVLAKARARALADAGLPRP
ncbi:MAG TPA: hypothetical protein VNI01_07795 [Elusimicrobiota bacterium]|jgi:hypothetical protein|nr:hypothetical protein [Elusimicrobiota bacterium]